MLQKISNFLEQPAIKPIHRQSVTAVLILTMLTNVVVLVIPLYILQVYDRVLLSRSFETLTVLSIGVGLVVLFNMFIEKARTLILVRLGNRYEIEMNKVLFDTAVIRSAYLNSTNIQALSDLRQVKNFLILENGFVILLEAPWSAFYIAILFIAHPLLGGASLFFILLMLAITIFDEHLTGSYIEKIQDGTVATNQKMSEILMSSHVVESMGMRNSMFEHWKNTNSNVMSDSSKSSELAGKFHAFTKLIRFIQTITMTFIGVYLMIDGHITLGAMIVAGLLAAKGTAPLEMFIMGLKNFNMTRKALKNLNDQILQTSLHDTSFSLPLTNGSVSMERVVYAPIGTETTTLKGVTFNIDNGEFLGIIGPSGSGKSTIAKLLAGLYKPYSGVVRIGGADISMYPKEEFGKKIGYLPQDVTLFEGTVRDNIARFSGGSDEAVLEAAAKANVHDMILKLPKGYETQVGSRGLNLSGGQRQKIALARCLYNSPKLVILDEPNSALDHDNELLLIQTLKLLKSQDTTLVVISHKPSLIADADKLLVINNGAVEKFGKQSDIISSYKGA